MVSKFHPGRSGAIAITRRAAAQRFGHHSLAGVFSKMCNGRMEPRGNRPDSAAETGRRGRQWKWEGYRVPWPIVGLLVRRRKIDTPAIKQHRVTRPARARGTSATAPETRCHFVAQAFEQAPVAGRIPNVRVIRPVRVTERSQLESSSPPVQDMAISYTANGDLVLSDHLFGHRGGGENDLGIALFRTGVDFVTVLAAVSTAGFFVVAFFAMMELPLRLIPKFGIAVGGSAPSSSVSEARPGYPGLIGNTFHPKDKQSCASKPRRAIPQGGECCPSKPLTHKRKQLRGGRAGTSRSPGEKNHISSRMSVALAPHEGQSN